MKLTSTSIPTALSSSSSLSESSENYLSFLSSSVTVTTPLSDLHEFMTSVKTWSIIGAISVFKILQSSEKYDIAVSLSSNLFYSERNPRACFVNTSMYSIGNFPLPTADASYPAHIIAYPLAMPDSEALIEVLLTISNRVLRMSLRYGRICIYAELTTEPSALRAQYLTSLE